MRGNNVHAYDDLDANDQPPVVEPDCGPGLECTFPLDLTQPPPAYTSAAVANLFYWTNLVHDIQWHYGFDEVSGNFQVNNFGRGGLGGGRREVRGARRKRCEQRQLHSCAGRFIPQDPDVSVDLDGPGARR